MAAKGGDPVCWGLQGQCTGWEEAHCAPLTEARDQRTLPAATLAQANTQRDHQTLVLNVAMMHSCNFLWPFDFFF